MKRRGSGRRQRRRGEGRDHRCGNSCSSHCSPPLEESPHLFQAWLFARLRTAEQRLAHRSFPVQTECYGRMGGLMEFRVLGPLQVSSERGELPVGGRQRALLALLLIGVTLAQRGPADRRAVGERPPRSAANMTQGSSRACGSSRRQALVVSRPIVYALAVPADRSIPGASRRLSARASGSCARGALPPRLSCFARGCPSGGDARSTSAAHTGRGRGGRPPRRAPTRRDRAADRRRARHRA